MNSISDLLQLSLRLLARDLRSGRLNVLILALLTAVVAHNTIGFLNERITNAMTQEKAAFLGGDLVISTSTPAPSLLTAAAASTAIEAAQTAAFNTVVMSDLGMQLSTVRAVSTGYPLVAPLHIKQTADAPETQVRQGPDAGSVWIDPRLMDILQVKMGDSILIGEAELVVERLLTREPDNSDGFYSLIPRVMISMADLERTEVIQPASKVTYLYQFAGEAAAINKLQQTLEPTLGADQQIVTIESRTAGIGNAFGRARQYLEIASLAAFLLASVSIAMGAQHFGAARLKAAALLRCLGLPGRHILVLFSLHLFIIGVVCAALGGVIGWLLHFVAVSFLSGVLPEQVALPSWLPTLQGLAICLLVLTGFCLPMLLRLRATPPLLVLRQQVETSHTSRIPGIISGLITLSLLLLFYVQKPAILLMVIGIGFGLVLLTSILNFIFTRSLNRLAPLFPAATQIGLRNLSRRHGSTLLQLFGFGLTGMAMIIVVIVRGDVIDYWGGKAPEDAPNRFISDIPQGSEQAFIDFIERNQLTSSPVYPIVNGKLTLINGENALQQLQQNGQNPQILDREHRLTWTSTLDTHERVVAGDWWGHEPPAAPEVSIAAEIAQMAGIEIGDQLSFSIYGQQRLATVSSIRQVDWQSFNPAFIFILSPGATEDIPYTSMTALYLPEDHSEILRPLLQAHPSVYMWDADGILNQIRQILSRVTAAIEFILIFILAAGLGITYTVMMTTMPQRLHEGAVLRALGSSRRQLRTQQLTEYLAVGVLSGVTACLGVETLKFAIVTLAGSGIFLPTWWMWAVLPPLFGLIVATAGLIGTRNVVKQSPLLTLRDL